MPRQKDTNGPSALERWRLLLRYVTAERPAIATWRRLDPNWKNLASDGAPPVAFAWRLLDEEGTRKLTTRAKERGVSLNSLLLWALGRVVEPELDTTRGQMRWQVPVNLRGPIQKTRATANHSAFVTAVTTPGASPADVHRSIREGVERNEHFTTFRAITLGAVIGGWGTRMLLREEIRRGHSWVGAFSNLGAWPDRKDDRGADDAWLACPPVSYLLPFCTGAVTWRGRLGLTMQVHRALSYTKADLETWLEAWCRTALA